MKKWLKVGAVIVIVGLATIILAPRVYVRNSDAHLVIDGRVMSDFKLYFGPNGRLLLRIGAKQTRQVFMYEARGQVWECPPQVAAFPPFSALLKSRGGCSIATDAASVTENSMLFTSRDGHVYEVSWQGPSR